MFNNAVHFVLLFTVLLLFPGTAQGTALQGDADGQGESNVADNQAIQVDDDLPLPDAGYVTDLAGLLSKKQHGEIQLLLLHVEKQTGVEIAVLTVDSVKDYGSRGLTIEQFAQQVFNKWGIGNMPANRGVLIVVAPKDREARIELGDGYDDSRDADAHNVMQRNMIPMFKQGNYAAGVREGVIHAAREFANYSSDAGSIDSGGFALPLPQSVPLNQSRPAGSSSSRGAAPVYPAPASQKPASSGPNFFMLILLAIGGLIVIVFVFNLFRRGTRGWGYQTVSAPRNAIRPFFFPWFFGTGNSGSTSGYKRSPGARSGSRSHFSSGSGNNFGGGFGGGFSGGSGGSHGFGGGSSSGGGATGKW